MSGENTTSDGGGESSIDELQAEIEQLKQRIADERRKLCDKTADLVAESIEPIVGLNIKVRINSGTLSEFGSGVDILIQTISQVRRSLKGHNAKVLCLDWSTDKRHLVSSSQVRCKTVS